MKFTEIARCAIQAAQPVIWIRTHENIEAKSELDRLFAGFQKMDVYFWDCVRGLTLLDKKKQVLKSVIAEKPSSDIFGNSSQAMPLTAAINHFAALTCSEPDTAAEAAVLIVDNFHHHSNDPAVVQVIQNFTATTRKIAASIVLLAHYDQVVMSDLRSYATVIDHDLPDLSDLVTIFSSLLAVKNPTTQAVLKQFNAADKERISESGLGLSRLQFESEASFALAHLNSNIDSITTVQDAVTHLASTIQERKATLFNSEGLIQITSSLVKREEIGGAEGLVELVKKRFSRTHTRHRKDRNPRGLILLGPPGTGKTTLCKAIANMLGLLMVTVDVGSLKQGVVGASEGRIRRMFQILKAMRRIVVFIDEIEKVFPTGNELDSGVSADQLTVWLTNLSDPDRLYYVVASANQCNKLPAPLLRSGRFDGIVMVDLPKQAQQKKIWALCREKFGISADDPLPSHHKWTGAEIEGCCDAADAMGVPLRAAAKLIVPVSTLNPDEIEKVQNYAKNRAIDAETGEIYVGYSEEPQPVVSSPGSRRVIGNLKPEEN